MVENLWCPDEVLQWKSKLDGNYFEEDEDPPRVTIPKWEPPSSWDEVTTFLEREKEKERQAEENRKRTQKPAYSPTRHTAAIERILHILHGLDPQIHTTPMWYTVHKVGLQLEVTKTIQDHIISWLYGNLDFIESHPAFVLQTAHEMQNVDLFRDAYAILVGKQLLGGRMDNGGVFRAITKIPAEAQPWAMNITHTRKSMQARLERLHNYISSLAWLDNSRVVPEYAKVMVPLMPNSHTSPELAEKLIEVDRAIRSDIKAQLAKLFAYSEDPGNPNWMNPWEKAVFDMLPGHNQIFSRMYWRQLAHIPSNVVVFGDEVERAIWAWECALEKEEMARRDAELARVKEEQERMRMEGVVAGLLREQEKFNKRVMLGRPEGILEVRNKTEAPTKGKEVARGTFSEPRYSLFDLEAVSHPSNPQPSTPQAAEAPLGGISAQKWKCMSSHTKDIFGPSDNPVSAPRPAPDPQLTLPPMSITRVDSDTLPSINLSVPFSNLPPAYDSSDALPCYTETDEESPTPKIGEKRKSIQHNWPEDSDTDEDDLEIRCKGEDLEGDEAMTAPLLPRAERIEIANPQRKRRCSVEREDNDENITEASFITQAEEPYIKEEDGEPEMFKISGVYEDLEPNGRAEKLKTTLAFPETKPNPVGLAFDDAMAQAEAELGCKLDETYWRQQAAQLSIFNSSVDLTPKTWTATDGTTLARVIDDPTPNDPSFWRRSRLMGQKKPLKQLLLRNLQHASHTLPLQEENISPLQQENTIPAPGSEWIPQDPVTVYTFLNRPQPESRINIHQLWKECLAYLHAVGAEMLKVSISFEPVLAEDGQLLVCMREQEWRFCPMWAGGLDDGSGGVFGDNIGVDKGTQIELGDTKGKGKQVEADTKGKGKQVELEVRGLVQELEDEDAASIAGSYDDCILDSESVASFSTGGFSFGVLSDFADSESEVGTIAGDETESESGTEAGSEAESEIESATEAGDSDDVSSDGFEEVDWDDDF